MGIKGRVYTKSQENSNYKEPDDLEKTIKHLEETGELIDNLSHYMINDRLVELHNKILKIIDIIERYPNNRRIPCLKKLKKEYTERFSNLSKIIISSVIKKYKTFSNYYDELYVSCLIEVLTALFKKRKYDPKKARLSSYIFEISRQTMVKETSKIIKSERNKDIPLYLD